MDEAPQTVVSLRAELAARDARLSALEQQLATRDAQLASRDAWIAALEAQVAQLMGVVASLQRRLGKNSSNSSLPPSSDFPGSGTGSKETKGAKGRRKRKRGGQPGHRGARRKLLPPEEVDEIIDFFPPECENCWRPLPETPDPHAKRYQSTELPPIKPHTTEYRRHEVRCPCCSYKTRAAYNADAIPASPFGPRLMSVVALLTGVYHVSRRKTVTLLSDIVGVRLSLGAVSAIEKRVSDAVIPAVDEAWQQVRQASVKHTDGTSWFQAGVLLSLWTIATSMATVFKIVANERKDTLRGLFVELRGILVSDRAAALKFWAMEHRQICWAHLIRKFVSFSERDGPGGALGRELLEYTGIVFEYWNDHKVGKISRSMFRTHMIPVRKQVEALLERAAVAEIAEMSGSCANMLAHRAALWTFVDRLGVEPTNNHAERELRAFVLWRKRSFGSQSERGNRFAERLMTVAHTARKQNRHVLTFLTACCTPRSDDTPAPSLFRTAA